MDKEYICCFCGEKGNDYGNNPAPVKEEGRCCDDCNLTVVVPARLKSLKKEGYKYKEEEGVFIMNNSDIDLRICMLEPVSEDEDDVIEIGVIERGAGLRVFPKTSSIYIEEIIK